ncbi:hypothetical protein Gotur_035613 [Gossypium turneri]
MKWFRSMLKSGVESMMRNILLLRVNTTYPFRWSGFKLPIQCLS